MNVSCRWNTGFHLPLHTSYTMHSSFRIKPSPLFTVLHFYLSRIVILTTVRWLLTLLVFIENLMHHASDKWITTEEKSTVCQCISLQNEAAQHYKCQIIHTRMHACAIAGAIVCRIEIVSVADIPSFHDFQTKFMLNSSNQATWARCVCIAKQVASFFQRLFFSLLATIGLSRFSMAPRVLATTFNIVSMI